MEGKFTTWEKYLELGTFLIILIAGVYKGIHCDGDIGIVIMLSFTAVLLFSIFSVAAFFPATWRMTDKQKKKIEDLTQYQGKYRRVLVIVNVVLSFFMIFLILTLS